MSIPNRYLQTLSEMKRRRVIIALIVVIASFPIAWSSVYAQTESSYTSPLNVYLYKSDYGFPGERVPGSNVSEDGMSLSAELDSGFYTLGIAPEGATVEEVRSGVTGAAPVGKPDGVPSYYYYDYLEVGSSSLSNGIAPVLLQERVVPAGPDYYGPFTPSTVFDSVKQKVSFKLDAGSELLAVRWIMPEILLDDLGEDQFSLESRDGTQFELVGDAAYDAIFRSGLTELEFYVETLCEAADIITIPITLLDDPAPTAEILPIADASFAIGESAHVSAMIADAGRNLDEIRAIVESGTGDRTTVGEYSFYGPSSDAEQFELRVPVVITPDVSEGAASLIVSVEDKEGQVAESPPVPVLVEPTSLTAYTRLQGPVNRVPAGAHFPVTLSARHVLPIEHIDIAVSGPGLIDGVGNQSVDVGGEMTFDREFLITVSAGANIGEEIVVQIRVYDSAGAFTEVVERAQVGIWGETTLMASDNAELTEAMRFANIVVQPSAVAAPDADETYADFRINMATIPLNSIRVEAGATVSVANDIGEIIVFDTLEIEADALLRVDTHIPAQGTRPARILGHGGDAEGIENIELYYNMEVSVEAYDSYKDPVFPGGGVGGGGVLHLSAGSLVLNGRIEANGDEAFVDPASGNKTPAGGSIRISTGIVSGEGVVEASGGYLSGYDSLSGAGGRIAIYYEDYSVAGEALVDHIQLIADSPSLETPKYRSGTGTVFLKTPAQEFGELRINSYSFRQGSTTLRSIGTHPVTGIIPSVDVPNGYDISVQTASWQIPDLENWELGLQGLYLRLLGGTAGSNLYEVVSNTADTITVQSLTDLTTLAATGLQGIVPLDFLYLGDTVEVKSKDTIAVSDFRIRRPESIVGVAGFETPVSTTVAVSEVSHVLNSGLFYGNLAFPSDIVLSQSDIKAIGDVNIAGGLRVENLTSDYEFDQSFNVSTPDGQVSFPQVFDVDIEKEGQYSLQAEAGSSGLSVLLFRNDAELDRSDFVFGVTARNNYERPAVTSMILSPGSYVAYLYNSRSTSINTVLDGSYQSSSNQSYQAHFRYSDAKDSSLLANSLNIAGALTVDSADLSLGVRNRIDINAGINLIESDPVSSGATNVTGLSGNDYSSRMAIVSGGPISIGQYTAIEMSEYGDFGGLNFVECHGGVSNRGQGPQAGCAYGDYRSPSLPATSRRDQDLSNSSPMSRLGGGFVSLTGTEIDLQGQISATGTGAAGGSVKLVADTLSGTGNITVHGTRNSATNDGGSGGRISLVVDDDSSFTGNASASGSSAWSGRYYGAGTIFKHTVEGPGGLLEVNANGVVNPEAGTPVGRVGKRLISSVDQLPDNRWRIHIDVQDSEFSGVVPCTNGICQVQYHPFVLAQPGDISLVGGLDTPSGSLPARTTDVLVFRDDGSLDISDLVNESYTELFIPGEYVDGIRVPPKYQIPLDAGNYVLAVGTKFGNFSTTPRRFISAEFSLQEAVNGSYYSDDFIAWDYDLTLTSDSWSSYSLEGNGSLDGQYVSLDADSPDAPLYRIITNTASSIDVETSDDLHDITGNTLIGVHELDRLITSSSASLSFGNDRLVLNDPANSSIEIDTLTVGELSQNALEYFLNAGLENFPLVSNPLTLPEFSLDSGDEYRFEKLSVIDNLVLQNQSRVQIDSVLSIGGNLSLNGDDTELTVDSLTATNLFIDGSTVFANHINVSGDISLINGGRLVPQGTYLDNSVTESGRGFNDKSYGELVQAYATPSIFAGGQILVDATSEIDADGQGFPGDSLSKGIFGCDAGVEYQITRVCLPRNYLTSNAPGAGRIGNRGGGAVVVEADSIVLVGEFRANGLNGSLAGFGGNIRIIARQLSGTGSIQANAGISSRFNRASGGGLVQLIVQDRSQFSGAITTHYGRDSSNSDAAGGAGIQTYRTTAGVAPDLNVSIQSGESPPAESFGTRVPRVGEFTISDVEYLGENRWKVFRDQSQAHDFYAFENPTLTPSGAGSLYSFDFIVENRGSVEFHVPDPGFRSMIRVYRIEQIQSFLSIPANDESSAAPREINRSFTLSAGEYTAVVGEYAFSDSDSVSGIHPGTDNVGGSIEITLQQGIPTENIWSAKDTYPDGMFEGLHIDLDSNEPNNPLYSIENSFENALVIETTDDLLGYRGETMVGVHVLNRLNVTDGASVDFGEDRIQLLDPTNSSVHYDSVRSGGYIGQGPNITGQLP